ncbi:MULTISPECIES: Crp/Fnr family transcriptional regulator [unclassified Lebetimonas]|uniref:Crp/Fnr family transcriptional regulator n=1 Tax=unclassified Lebetimonas TaxID=2648158 RepID=UPI00046500A4|nr:MULTISPECIES: Crp/Fnr family transcriptional regulator [unclassified Lebetimonas]
MINKLRKIFLFFNVKDELLKEIASFCLIKKYTKNEIIFFEGEKRNKFFAIIKGHILMYDSNEKGDVIPKNQFGCGDVFGLISQIQNRPYCLSAVAQSESDLIEIDFSNFSNYISKPPFSDRIIKMLSNQILQEVEFNKLQKYDATKRVILKKYMLAKELGMSPETLSRILSRLKNDGIICYCEKSIKVTDKEKLRDIINGSVSYTQ